MMILIRLAIIEPKILSLPQKNAAATIEYYIPVTVMLAEAMDGLLLVTVQV